MARRLGALALLLTPLAIPMLGVQPQVLQLKPNQPILSADAQLKSQGWRPAGEPGLQPFERELAGNQLPSLSGCSLTPHGFEHIKALIKFRNSSKHMRLQIK